MCFADKFVGVQLRIVVLDFGRNLELQAMYSRHDLIIIFQIVLKISPAVRI